MMARHGCKPMLMYPHWDPFLGMDLLFTALKSVKESDFLAKSNDRFKRIGKSFGYVYLGSRFFGTIDVENVQAVLATSSQHFELGSRRREAMAPLLGQGIFAVDGDQWRHSRAMLRPNFTKHQLRGCAKPEDHFQNLLALIPATTEAVVDLQDLFHKFTMDSATEFLFGRSVGSLSKAKEGVIDTFSPSFEVAVKALAVAVRLGPISKLFTSRKVVEARREVHAVVQGFVNEALEYREKDKDADINSRFDDGRYIFLRELAKVTSNPRTIRDELLTVILAGRDTTASLLSNLFFCLARDSRIWTKLRREVSQLSVDFNQSEVAGLDYIGMCIKECKVPIPSVHFNVKADQVQR